MVNQERQAPDKIIFATSSKRKMMVLNWLLNEQDPGEFLVEKNFISEDILKEPSLPLYLQSYFETFVYNGDGQIKDDEEHFVGEYNLGNKKVPVFVRPTNGETKGNDPIEQAKNKSQALSEYYQGENVLIVAMDTVGSPDTIEGLDPLGKPENDDSFQPFIDDFPTDFLPDKNLDIFEIDDMAVDFFKAYYLATLFPPDTKMLHSNGISIVNPIDKEQSREELIQLESKITEELFEVLDIFIDCGGGGVFQQTVDWLGSGQENNSFLKKYFVDNQIPKNWDSLTDYDKRWLLFFQIIGIPLWVVLEEIDTLFQTDIELA